MKSSVSVDKAAVEEFISGCNVLSADVYLSMTKTAVATDFIVSPFSMNILLALIQSGCKKKAGEELATVLHLPLNPKDTESAIKIVNPQLRSHEGYHWHSFNRVYVCKQAAIKREFKASAKKLLQTDIENVDFSNCERAASLINEWIKKQSGNVVEEVIEAQNLQEDTKMVLLNVLYLKAGWLKPFQASLTTKQDFYKTETNTVKVDMMEITGHFHYYESHKLDAKFMELQFEDECMSMIVGLPNTKEGLGTLEHNATSMFKDFGFSLENVNVRLPKFKIESQIDFKPILQQLGVLKAFETRADFSGIIDNRSDMYISVILQKTFIHLDEQGIGTDESSEIMLMTGGNPSTFKVKTFHADHPFVFFIKRKELICFCGRVVCPTE